MRIDIHSHIEIAEALQVIPEGMRAGLLPKGWNTAVQPDLSEALRDPRRKISDMEKMGIDYAILSVTPAHFYTTLQPHLALKVTRLINDRIAASAETYPDKFAGMAVLPLQDMRLSVSELERAALELRLKGVEVPSNVQGRYLGHECFLPLFEKLADLDLPVFVHPFRPAGAERMNDFYLSNLVGNPLDTTLAAAHLIFSGVFDRFPGLKIILAHAGGQLPYVCGRLDHGFNVRPECRKSIRRSPLDYMKQFYFDTISHNAEALRFLLSMVGADRVLMATDHPYDMGDDQPIPSVESVAGLSREDREKIMGGNAELLFRLG
jgi:aminocarboxymuconate-semialdehyde decarboxylase